MMRQRRICADGNRSAKMSKPSMPAKVRAVPAIKAAAASPGGDVD
jgi:hypothetical protein